MTVGKSSDSGTFPGLLRRSPADPSLRAEFEDLARLAALACRVPAAVITAATDATVYGVASHGCRLTSHPRGATLCDLTMATGGPLVIDDVAADPRAEGRRGVCEELGMRFYAAVPVLDPEGPAVGTICILDREPRRIGEPERHALTVIAARVTARLRERELEAEATRLRTERDVAQQTLDLHREVVSNMHDGVLVIRASDGSIVFANPRLEKMFGYPPDGLTGRHTSVLNSPRAPLTPAQVAEGFFAQLRVRGYASGEILNVTAQGRDFWTRVHISSFFHPTLGPVWISVQQDITEEKSAKSALAEADLEVRRAQRIEAVGRLAGGIAHEFNNLLTAILGHAELSLMDLPQGHPVRARIDEIHRSSGRAASLTHQLLAFSGRQILQPRVFDAAALLRRLEERLRRAAGGGVQLELRIPCAEAWVRADPEQTENVLLNLVAAAQERMPSGGRLLMEVRPDRGGDRVSPGDWVLITARDSGPVLDVENLARVFEPFHGSPGASALGGLALAVVYGIVTQSGGHAVAFSDGEGLEVRLYLPAGDGSSARRKVGSAIQSFRGSETVLVVEDEAPVRTLVRDLLVAHGYRVLEAACGEEALERLERDPQGAALVLTDVMMPGITGRDLAARVRQRWPALGVLLMSGFDSFGGSPGAESGADLPFIAKPFRARDLAKKVREVLDSRKK